MAVGTLTLSAFVCMHLWSCQFQTPPLTLSPSGDVTTVDVPHFLTLREPELGAGRGWVPVRRCLDRSTCSPPDCVWEGETSLMYILKAPEEVLPPACSQFPVLSPWQQLPGAPRVAKIWVWEAASTVASRNRESWGKGRLPPCCRLYAVTGLFLPCTLIHKQSGET